MTRSINLRFDAFSGLYILVAFVVIFGALRPTTFLSIDTVHLLASAQAVNGMMAIAVLVPLVCGQFDLSIGATANLAGMIAVIVQVQLGMPVLAALGLGVVAGVVVGFVNGFVVVKWKVNSFIATLGMGSILAAVQTIVTGNRMPAVPQEELWSALTQTDVLGFNVIVVYLIIIVAIAWWVMEKTPLGRAMVATGSNPEAARLAGVRTERWSWLSFMISGGLSALAGVLFVSLTGPSVSFGQSLVLPAFAAVFLGSTQFKPGRFNVIGTVIAIFVLATGVLGLQLITSQVWINDLFNGVAVIAAVALAVSRRPGAVSRRRGRSLRTSAGGERPSEHASPRGNG